MSAIMPAIPVVDVRDGGGILVLTSSTMRGTEGSSADTK